MTQKENFNEIQWWTLSPRPEWKNKIPALIENKCLSYGKIGLDVEKKLSSFFNIEYSQLYSSGTAALISAFSALDLHTDDEVLIPRRTFIAPLNALHLLKLKPKLIDTDSTRPTVNFNSFIQAVTKKTKAACIVHLNGRAGDIKKIADYCKDQKIFLIEDSSQAFDSHVNGQKLGTFGDIGVFSFGVTKAITCGQGGLAITKNEKIAQRLKHYIFQGRNDLFETEFSNPGGNFRLSDLLSSMLIEQIDNWAERKQLYLDIYNRYFDFFKNSNMEKIKLIPVHTTSGEFPVWIEALAPNRSRLREFMMKKNIQIQFLPNDLDLSSFPNWSEKYVGTPTRFSTEGIILPCGPDFLVNNNFTRVTDALLEWEQL